MSSYGEDYSDEERNYIDHGGASQGESDVEAHKSMSGHATVNIGGSCSSGGDGNRDEPKATASSWDVVPVWTRDWGSSGDRTENLTGCTVDHSGLENEETKSRVATGLPKEQLGISTLIHCGSPQSHWNDPVPQLKPMGNLTTAEFCDFSAVQMLRLSSATMKLFSRSPKDLLCQNSKFFDRALNGKFKEGIEQTIRLPEDTVMAFQMMLQWIYTGNITTSQDWGNNDTMITSMYLDFFKLADKIDLLGPLTPMFQKFRKCILAADANLKSAICSCSWNLNHSGTDFAMPHSADCNTVYANCSSKQSHMDILWGGTITSKHIQTAFELNPDHEVRKILAQACVNSYMLSVSMNFKFRFMKELETVGGFCQALLKEVAGTTAKNSKILDPLNGSTETTWPPGFMDRSGWN
ncbi:hypothetical protein BKA64DRAFT_636629 [Cadophora sp. MPI-SDFR-AT-0126]|nr:hypothetical protein BKA64DRAFT_636629 [Leotiomycetes sp. MPI-SDFR-AT-0126]